MSYPEEADVFTDVEADDPLIQSDPNVAYTGIENTQGLVGALGKPQSWSTTFSTLVRKYRRGMQVKVDGATLTVAAGEIVLENTDGSKLVFRHNADDIAITAANIDTGSLVATTYYVYAIAPSAASTSPIQFSTDINAPSGIGTAPYAKIGQFQNESIGALAVTFAGPHFEELELGAWIPLLNTTVYHAHSDGFVVANQGITGNAGVMQILTDSANPPTTIRTDDYRDAPGGSHSHFSATCPVKKNDFFQVTGAVNIYWIPLE